MAAVYPIEHSGYDLAPAALVTAATEISFVIILGLRESSSTSFAGKVQSAQAYFSAE
jgi:hypothetical protein